MNVILSLLFFFCMSAQAKNQAKNVEISAPTLQVASVSSANIPEVANAAGTSDARDAKTEVKEAIAAKDGENKPLETTSAVSSTALPATDSLTQNLNLKETEIPVNLDSVKKTATSDSPLIRLFFSVCIVGILGTGAFYLIRKYRFANPKSEATQIKVLSQHYLGPKKSLAIVRVAGESVLIGITDHSISMIKSLSLLDEDIPEETPKEFKKVFSLSNSTKRSPTPEETENKEDFSISGIKDFVSSKMKNMRSLE